MKSINVKRFSVGIMVLWTASCLAQTQSGFPIAPPSANDQQIQAKDLEGKRGKLQVDDFTGSFGYSIPIQCAPARNDSQPALALTYSSKNENGWCGVGWKLDVGYIERNTQNGIPIPYSAHFPLKQYDDSKGFILNLYGKQLKLLPAATNGSLIEYRAEVDTDFLRCICDTNNNKWQVYDKSGTIYSFGKTANSRVINPKSGWSGGYNATFHWALDQIVTATGDWTTIAFNTYTSPFTGQSESILYPSQITYNGHTNYNGYGSSVVGTYTITFQTEQRSNDWRFSYRWGFRTEQCRRLTNIVCQVNGQQVWHYALSYGTSLATERSLLKSVTVYGSSDSTPLPVQTFTYQGNTNKVSFGSPVQWGGFTAPSSSTETFVTTVYGGDGIADLVDIDGDGLPDWVVYPDSSVLTRTNRYQVQKNLGMKGTSSFGSQYDFGPTSTGGGGTPSANNPIPDGDSSWAGLNAPHMRLRDINGDGLPDRVCDWWNFTGNSPNTYTNFMVMTNTGTGFSTTATPWPVSDGPATAAADGNLQYYQCVESQDTGVDVAFFDVNGDGLPDRIIARYNNENQGPMTNFWVQLNTGSGFTTTNLFGPYTSQNWNTNVQSYYWAGIETPNVHMVDINGDGLPDRVMMRITPGGGTGAILPQNLRTNFMVEYNDGYSFECTNTSTAVGGGADPWPGVNPQWTTNYDYAEVQNLPYVGMFDVNGDGLPDRVMLDDTTANNNSTSKSWLVYLNTGHGFDPNPIHITNILDQSIGQTVQNDPGWWGPESSYSGGSIPVTLMDINGDGLLDRVMTVYGNNGGTYFLVQTNTGPYPDLLTTVSNGIGGTMTVSYVPSTVWDNRKDPTLANSGSTLPYPQYTVATVINSDGINPPRTNSYSYAGGFYDGSRHEFSGFAVVTNIDATLRTTVTYFHTGGGRNYSSLGEYQDGGNFAKRGMAYRIESYGYDSLLYHVAVNQIDQTGFNNNTRFFPFISQTFEFDYPGGGSPRATGTKFVYDVTTGNLTNKTVWGEVTNVNLSTFAAPTDVNTSDNQYYQYVYANIGYTTPGGTFYITDHPATTALTSDAGGSSVVQQTQYTYNSSNPGGGTLATKLVQISPGNFAANGYGGYNSYGLPTLKTNPVGVVTTITYDSTYNTYPATTTVGSLPPTTTSYDARSGLITSVTDPMGVTVANTYDTFYRLTESDKTPVSGTQYWMKKMGYNLGVISGGTAVSYIAQTNNDGVNTISGVESRTYVDGFGRAVQTRTQGEAGNYRVISTAYDGRGNVLLTTWPIFGSSSAFSKPTTGQTANWIGFDAAGRVATNCAANITFDANGAFSSEAGVTQDSGSPLGTNLWSYANGSDPWWIVYTDEDGKIRRYGLDAFGRTNQIQEVDGGNTYTTTLKYDLANNLTNIVNANTQSIYFAYNDAGGLVAMADPHLGQWTYVRDYAGRVRVQTDARGDVVSNSYVNAGQQDPLGRLQVQTVFSTNYSNHVLVPAFTNTYVYDNSDDGNFTLYPGLLYRVTDSEGWEKTGYDNRGRVIKTARHLNINNQTYTNSYTYNDGDKVTTITYPNSGPTITNSYLTGGSLGQVSRVGGSPYYTVSATGFDEFGHVTNFLYGNTLTTTRSYYSTSKRLKTISCSVFNRTYTYSAGEDILSLVGTGINGTANVTYDNLHRIKSYTGPSGNYGYDSVGNMTTNIESGTAVAYSYANPRKQAVRTAFGYTNLYDLCGNMIVRHGGLTNSQAMTYDAENRLKIFSQAGSIVVEYGYADDGARLWKRIDQSATNVQVWIGNNYEEKGGKTLFNVYADGELVCTFEPTSTLNGGSVTTNVGYYYHEDNLNSSCVLSSPGGTLQETNVYYPFGRIQLTAAQPGTFQVSRQFTGQVKDDETGLYYYNARYFDPELGRFIQPDDRIPDLSNPQSYNRYSYVANNPLRYADPSGHFAFIVPVYLAGAALTTYAVDHLYWNARIAASQVSAAQNIDRMVQAHGYVNYAEFAAAHQTSSHPAQAGAPQQVQAAAALGAAGADAVLTAATMITPELRGTTLLSSEEKLYRGVPGNGTEKANLGAQGIAKPRGTALDPKSLENHVMGADANAGVTSWTTDRNVAKSFSGDEGTIIEVDKSAVANQVVPRPPVQKYGAEKEVLLKGTIQGKPTTP